MAPATTVAPADELMAQLRGLDPAAPLPDRLDALEGIIRWVIERSAVDRLPRPAPRQVARLRMLLRCLDDGDARSRLAATIAAVVRDTSAVAVFAEAGLPNDRGLARETMDRLSRRLLPRPPDHVNLERFLSRIFRHPRDCAWIGAAPIELWLAIAGRLGDIWGPMRDAMADAVALICTRVSALGLGEDLLDRGQLDGVRSSPFFRLPRAGLDELPGLIAECRCQVAAIHQTLESRGVSVDVVYCLDAIRRLLARVEAMLPLLSERGEPIDRVAAARALFAGITAARQQDDSIRQLVRNNLRLLARKVIERVGQTGEHYVTVTRNEYWRMMASAAGGGALTAITCVIKFLTKWGHFPLFIDGVVSATNYAASFIVMQLLGFTLATKQPSMTAAALAGTIRETQAKGSNSGDPDASAIRAAGGGQLHQLDDLVTIIARISRSQLAAAVGNVLVVIPAVVLIDLLCVVVGGGHFLDARQANAAVQSFHPLHSGTIFFAALTGVLLWMSSLGGGWLDNWVVYRRIPDGIRHHRLGRVVGRAKMERIADFVAHNVAGFGGNFTLGVLLGMTPVLGVFFGLPLDVRHVTLSTGSLAFSVCSLGTDALTTSNVQWACLGIVLIGLLNFGVSFLCALAVALRAREVGQRERLLLLVAVGRRLVRSPLEFIYPPRHPRPPAAAPLTPS